MTWKAAILEGLDQIAAALAALDRPAIQVDRKRASDPSGHIEYSFDTTAPDGFNIHCSVFENSAQVGFEGWHEEFAAHDDAHDVVKLVAFGLSDQCKLIVKLAANRPYKWELLRRKGDSWQAWSEVGLIFYKWWAPKSEQTLQNFALTWDECRWDRAGT